MAQEFDPPSKTFHMLPQQNIALKIARALLHLPPCYTSRPRTYITLNAPMLH